MKKTILAIAMASMFIGIGFAASAEEPNDPQPASLFWPSAAVVRVNGYTVNPNNQRIDFQGSLSCSHEYFVGSVGEYAVFVVPKGKPGLFSASVTYTPTGPFKARPWAYESKTETITFRITFMTFKIYPFTFDFKPIGG
ncbi:MAG: hypothetical protein JSW62_02830 [Thermoplasmatales archaeon]|nr:MAG: hypothetical protein JSW62_02830 [Thermoplasmatales archaeon]